MGFSFISGGLSMRLLYRTCYIFDQGYIPVLTTKLFLDQYGIMRPTRMEIPIIARFLVDLMSMYCRLATTSPMNMPNPTTCVPPRTGYGMVTNTLANFPKNANRIRQQANIWNTFLLATY